MTAELQTDCELLREIYRDTASCPEQVDTTLRLAYADYLQENGDYDRAELIRVQYELETCSPPHKKLPYPDEPVPMTNRGQGHYTFTDYLRDGLVEGDRVDIYKQRPGKSSKWLYGLRVVKFLAGTGLGEREAVVRIDEHSGPWKGEKLKKRSDELIKLHPEWSRVTCPTCGGTGNGTRLVMTSPHIFDRCGTCGGTGDLFRKRLLYERDTPDGTESVSETGVRPVRWRCGFIDAVEVPRLEDVCQEERHEWDKGEAYQEWTFSPWAVAVAQNVKTLTRITPLDQQPTREEGGWEWYGLPDILNTPITKATFSSPDAAKDTLGRTICLVSRNTKGQR